MRSQLLVLSLISATALQGCGKNVERTGTPASPRAGTALTEPGTPLAPIGQGTCLDPIDTRSLTKVERFADIARTAGHFEMTKISALGATSKAISVITGEKDKSGKFEYTHCQDMSLSPTGPFRWTAHVPNDVNAQSGRIEENLVISQTVFADPAENQETIKRLKAEECTSLTDVIDGNGCPAAEIYKLNDNSFGVLRATETSVNGVQVITKIYAVYSGSEAPRGATAPSAPKQPSTPKVPAPSAPKQPSTPSASSEPVDSTDMLEPSEEPSETKVPTVTTRSAPTSPTPRSETKLPTVKRPTYPRTSTGPQAGGQGKGGQGSSTKIPPSNPPKPPVRTRPPMPPIPGKPSGGQGNGGQGSTTVIVRPAPSTPVTRCCVVPTPVEMPKIPAPETPPSETTKSKIKEKTKTETRDGETETKVKSKRKVKVKS